MDDPKELIPTDGRKMGEWETHYHQKRAKYGIRAESAYLFILMYSCILLSVLLWSNKLDISALLGDRYSERPDAFLQYCFSWLGGVFGGSVFAIKWLYRSVASGYWNEDRRAWRLLSPHLSGAVSFAFLCLVNSQFLSIFDSTSLDSPTKIYAVAFLVGYFSDSAIRKMQDVADVMFGHPTKYPPS